MPDRRIHDRRRFIIETLSPVHVGSGQVLKPGIEVIPEPAAGKTWILDIDLALERLPIQMVKSGGFRGVTDILPLLRTANVSPESVCLHVLPTASYPASADLRLAIRDGAGCPLLPGSSVKGALRTMFLAAGIRERLARNLDPVGQSLRGLRDFANPKFAAQSLERDFFRPHSDDPKFDLFRRLIVADATFDTDRLEVLFGRVNSPSQTAGNFLKPFSMVVEALVPGSKAEIEIALDDFLVSDKASALKLKGLGLSWAALVSRSRAHAEQRLTSDRAVFQSRGFSAAVASLDAIMKRIAESPEAVPLRLGWGIGWEGTTGGQATAAQRIELLKKFDKREGGNKIGKYASSMYGHSQPFPKSRRMDDPDHSGQPFGWVLLMPAGDEQLPRPRPRAVEAAPARPSEALAAANEEPREVRWERVTLFFRAGGGGGLQASGPLGKAEARQQDAHDLLSHLSEDKRRQLRKGKEVKDVTIEVLAIGTSWRIRKVVG